jgi:tetratricopeptide (TPR) repeat protein
MGAGLFVIFTLPGFPSPFYIPKEIFAAAILSLALLASFIKSIIKGEVKFSTGKFDIGVILIIIAYLVSSVFATQNKMEAFFYPGTTTFMVFTGVFYLIINQLSKKGKNEVLMALFASGILLTLSVIFTKLGVFVKIPQLPAYMKDATFNPMGAGLQSLVYLLALLPIGITQIIKDKDLVKRIFFGVASAVLIFGIIVMGSDMLPGKPQAPILPTWQTSWSILIDTIKQNPFLGTGPGNYLSAFNLYRPIAYNAGNLWQVRFSSANNFYFTLITEVGLIGLAALVVFLVGVYKKLSHDFVGKNWSEISLAIVIVAMAVVPAAPSLIFLLMALLAVFSASEEKSATIATGKVPASIVAAPVFLGVIALWFFGLKAVRAENYYNKALVALAANDAKNTYDYLVKAETLNPYVDRYHASVAQVDMALANSIASKKDITDSDKNTITQLVQQSISEGKATVALNPVRAGNWEVLAQIYRSIMSFAQGADQFSIQTYTQAVALDPINPDLRIALGGTYYALGDYDNAVNAFQLATVAKNDLANAHYNLAAAYAAKKDYQKAITEMTTVLSLVPKDSEDYKTATTVMDQLKAQKPADTGKATTENLTTPQKVQESNIEPPITLPQEATPPATP